ncbi:MAG: efflux RND transporter permease subunit [Acidobacteria bacterium]|nr:efflux RND transporter permease subunit [Acidobacteriota bacterium]
MIDWFARNSVAANLLMAFIAVSGVIGLLNIRGEDFPLVSLDMLTVEVPYLGAAPEEVEEGVCIRIEEAIQGIDGIKQITSTAAENMGTVLIEVELGADVRVVLDEVKNRVDAIDTFPELTEKPIISELLPRINVIYLAVSGPVGERTLKSVAERVRDDLASISQISQIELVGARPYEISVEVSEATLRRHALTFDDVARAVRRSSLDLPGGAVRSESGEVLLRTVGQAYRGAEYEGLVLMARPDGTRLHLGDVATVVDGFAETDQSARFDLQPAILVSVLRSGAQSDLEISDLVLDYVERTAPTLPPGISLTVWQNEGRVLSDRLWLMARNGATGFALVFIVLALLTELRLAFWVSLGIPISFLGAFMVMSVFDVTANFVSTFAFILVLGIVVDDAIIVGENVFRHREAHGDRLRSAIEGAREISKPVVFAVLTTVAAFSPLFFVPGEVGKVARFVPLVVVPCLLFSLVECLAILPAHLAHTGTPRQGPWRRFQKRIANGLGAVGRNVYRPALAVALRWRYLALATGIATLVLTAGIVLSGRIAFHFFPAPEAELISGSLTLPAGTPVAATSAAVARLEGGAERLRRDVLARTGQDVFRHVYAAVGDQPMAGDGPGNEGAFGTAAPHIGQVMIELAPAEERNLRAEELGNLWRELTGPIPEATSLTFGTSGPTAGNDVDVMLVGPDVEQLTMAANAIKAQLRTYAGVYDVSDTFQRGKEEVQLGITPHAETLGLSLRDLGRQVRQAFYGEEAQRIQRGRDDIRVMVRYPSDQRRSLGNLEDMRIRTPEGGEVPFRLVAAVEPGRGYASIKRVDRQRAVNVTAAIDESTTTSAVVTGALEGRILPDVLAAHPGVRYSLEGVQAEQQDFLGALLIGFALALFGIFALLAIPLKSYAQPLIIMSAIPFGFVGAVWGHIIMGVDVSMMSVMGLVALAGVVVNDSLVMVDFINRNRKDSSLVAAVQQAGAERFRPIVLTSLTTFAGLAPIMFEGSHVAEFILPLAVTLAFGVVFATFITLILVPTLYMIMEDAGWLLRSVRIVR